METRQEEKKDIHLSSHAPTFSPATSAQPGPSVRFTETKGFGYFLVLRFWVKSWKMQHSPLADLRFPSLAITLAAPLPLHLQASEFLQSSRLDSSLASQIQRGTAFTSWLLDIESLTFPFHMSPLYLPPPGLLSHGAYLNFWVNFWLWSVGWDKR